MDTFIEVITYIIVLLLACFALVWLVDKTPAKYRFHIGRLFILIGILFPIVILLMFLLDSNDNPVISFSVLIKAVIGSALFVPYSVNITKKAGSEIFFNNNCKGCQYCDLVAYSKGQQWCNSSIPPIYDGEKCISKNQNTVKIEEIKSINEN